MAETDKVIKPKLFTVVRCRAYMRKVHDGVHIALYNPDGTLSESKIVKGYKAKAAALKFDYEKCEHVEIADLSEFSGQSVEKVYRIRVEEEFTGCVVGYTRVDVAGSIGTDWCDGVYGPEYGYCFKHVTDRRSVAVVYFKNNCKRYVLLDDMKEVAHR